MFESEKTRLENIQSSIGRGLNELKPVQSHGGRWNICAGGPSLRKELKKIKKAPGKIVSMNGTHDYLIGKGIAPDYFVMTDPRESNERFLNHARGDVTYLIASHCASGVFDRLQGLECVLWHPLEYKLPLFSIGGGTTVGLKSIALGYALGYRDIHLYGFDGCIKESHHAYPQKENDNDEIKKVKYRGKEYRMFEWMMYQADNFLEMLQSGFKVTVHSNGIIKHIAKSYTSGD